MASSNWCFSCSILAFLKSAFSLLGWILSTWKAVGRYNSEHRLKKSPQHLTYACQGCIPGSKLHLSLKFNTCYGVILPIQSPIFKSPKKKRKPVPYCWKSSLCPPTAVEYLWAEETCKNILSQYGTQNCQGGTIQPPVDWHLHVFFYLLVIQVLGRFP